MGIHPDTMMGTVGLVVVDLARSIRYYTDNIGLAMMGADENSAAEQGAVLGVGGRALLHLQEQPDARPVQRGHSGLYHFAILLPSRRDLAVTLRHLIDSHTPLAGMSDHGVSEALYLTDPDGHGIEIYRDRPRAEWPFRQQRLQMTLDPLDVNGILAEVTSGRVQFGGMPEGTIIGHVHLHVRSIPEAEAFYCDTVGFDRIQRFGDQASFVSAGGYHHHLGLNVWAGVGAPPPPANSARLAWYEIRMPSAEALREVVARLHAAGVDLVDEGVRVYASDPSANHIVFVDASLNPKA